MRVGDHVPPRPLFDIPGLRFGEEELEFEGGDFQARRCGQGRGFQVSERIDQHKDIDLQ